MTLISFGALICSSSSDDVTEQFWVKGHHSVRWEDWCQSMRHWPKIMTIWILEALVPHLGLSVFSKIRIFSCLLPEPIKRYGLCKKGNVPQQDLEHKIHDVKFFQGCGHRVFGRCPKDCAQTLPRKSCLAEAVGVPDAVSELGQSRRFDPSKNHAPTITLANSLARFNEQVSENPLWETEKPKVFKSSDFSLRICHSVRLRWWNPNASCNSLLGRAFARRSGADWGARNHRGKRQMQDTRPGKLTVCYWKWP